MRDRPAAGRTSSRPKIFARFAPFTGGLAVTGVSEGPSLRAAAGRLKSVWTGLPANLRGILWLSAGALFFAIVDVFVKTLGRKFDAIEITFFRYATGMIVLTPLFLRMSRADFRTRKIGLHIMRMGFAFAAQLMVIVSVIYLPLADATAFMFSKPIFTTVVAVILLRELVSARRWIATVTGFAGVLVMLRPGSAGVDVIAVVAVAAALTFAIANVLIRILARTEPTTRILFYYHVGGVALFTGPAAWVWSGPVGIEWLLLGCVGGLTTAGMVCFVRAFSVGEANAVGPAENTRLIYAALFGFLLFSEVPSVWSVAGVLIIAGSTFYIAREEARKE